MGRGHSCEGPSVVKLWAQWKGGWWSEMPRGAELSHIPSVPVGLQQSAHAVALPPPRHREVPGLPCCS